MMFRFVTPHGMLLVNEINPSWDAIVNEIVACPKRKLLLQRRQKLREMAKFGVFFGFYP